MPEPKLAITTAILCADADSPWDIPLISRCYDSHFQTLAHPADVEGMARKNTASDNLGVTGSLQWLYEHTTAPIIAFLHSDLEIMEQGWDERVLREFDDPEVGVCGFGGALQLGADEIYKVPYELHQLRRINYLSNQVDWQTHGHQFEGECDVVTLDGFALIVRRALLNKWHHPLPDVISRNNFVMGNTRSGWPVQRYPYHNYDNALCLEARKQGYRVRLVGCKVQHHGGATSTTAEGQAYWHTLGTTDQEIHTQSHPRLYEDGRGWLPLRAK